jgi:hypothetical protein
MFAHSTFRPIFAAFLLCLAAGPAFSQAAPGFSQAAPARPSQVTAVTPTPDDRAREWLVLVDDKNYPQSWTQAAKAFQGRLKADVWAKDADMVRAPLGAVASRGLKSIDLTRNNLAVIRYDTAFARKAAAIETVTLAFENGAWAVSDYSVN